MADFIAMIIVWLLILFFTSAELFKRFKTIKALSFSMLINLILCCLCILLWFAIERDGFAQMFGALIYAIIFGAAVLILGIVAWLQQKSSRISSRMSH